jgi:hypothetical protein
MNILILILLILIIGVIKSLDKFGYINIKWKYIIYYFSASGLGLHAYWLYLILTGV